MSYSIIKATLLCWICLLCATTDAGGPYECRQRPVDFIFLVDGSRSVRLKNFKLVKQYVKNFASDFGNFSREDVQMGVVQFSTNVAEEIRLGRYSTANEFNRAVDDIGYMEMGTMTGEALKFVVTEVLQPSHSSRLDDGVDTILIILTDGKSQDHSRGEFTKYERIAKQRGVEIFAIGIGRRLNETELNQLASNPKPLHVYKVQRFEDIPLLKLHMPEQRRCGNENECELNTHNCSQLCIDTPGSYKCACRDGFVLQDDGVTCLPPDTIRLNNIWFTNITHTGARVHWSSSSPVEDEVVYLLGYSKSGGKSKTMSVSGQTALLQNLNPSTEYLVQVSFLTALHFSLPVEGHFTTLRLGQTEVTISNQTMTTFIIHWTAATGDRVTAYGIEYFPRSQLASQPPISALTVYTGLRTGVDSREYRVTSVLPDTNYVVKVTPLHGDLRGITSTARARTLKLAVPFIAVSNPTLSTLTARWKIRYNYRIKNWLLNIHSSDDTVNRNYEFNAKEVSTILDNLQPNKNYSVEIQAVLFEGYGRNQEEITTAKGYAFKRTKTLRKPIISMRSVTVSSFVVEWDKLNVEAESWLVKIFPRRQKSLQRTVTKDHGELSATFTDLIPFTRYKIEVTGRVRENGKIFKSPRGKSKARTKRMTAPPVRIHDVHSSYFQASWNTINVVVDEWIVKIYRDGSETPTLVTTVSGDQRENIFSGLQDDTDYQVDVVGVIRRGEITRESPKGTATSRTARNIVTPTVTIDDITPFSMRARWNDVNFPVLRWMVQIRRADFATSENDLSLAVRTVDGDQRTLDISELIPNTEYIIEVTAEGENDLRSGTGRNQARTNTFAGPTIDVTDKTVSSLSVRWSDINLPVHHWRVIITNEENDESETVTVSGEELTKVWTDLIPRTPYRVGVIGVVQALDTPSYETPTGQTSATTEQMSAPTIRIINVLTSSFRATWNPINVVVDEWVVKIYQTGNDTPLLVTTVSGDQRENIFSGLQDDTDYQVDVVGVIRRGEITRESPKGTATSRTVRKIVTPTVTIDDITPFSMRARWNDVNFSVLRWMVQIRRADFATSENDLSLAVRTVDGDQRTLDISELIPNTEYIIEVTAEGENDLRSGTGRNQARTNTFAGPTIDVTDKTVSSLSVRWSDINLPVHHWRVIITNEENDESETVTVSGEELTKVWTDLIPRTPYRVGVIGVVQALDTPSYETPTGQTSATTEQMSAPTIRIIDVLTSSFRATWNPINVVVDEWVVKIYQTGNDTPLLVTTVSGDQRENIFSGLQDDTDYQVDVVGVIRRGEITRESPKGTATSRTARNIVTPTVTIDDITPFSMRARWNDVNFPVLRWMVQIRRADFATSENDLSLAVRTVDGDQRTLDISELIPNTEYIIEVTAEGENDLRSGTGRNQARTNTFAGPTIDVTDKTVSSLSVRWSDINLPVHHWRVIITNEENDESETVTVSGEELTKVWTDLIPRTPYRVGVIGVVQALDTPSYETPTGQTSATTEQMSAPTIRIIDVLTSSFRATWNPINVVVDEWVVKIYQTGNDTPLLETTVSGDQTEQQFSELDPSTEYNVEVLGILRREETRRESPKGSATSTTAREIVSPAVTFDNITPFSMIAHWNDVNFPVLMWRGNIRKAASETSENNQPLQDFDVEGDVKNIEFPFLLPNTEYIVEVTAMGQENIQSGTGTAAARTQSFTRPNVNITEKTTSSISVRWSDINYPAQSWVITITNKNNQEFETETVSGLVHSHVFRSLIPDTTYSIRVVAVISTLESPTYESPAGQTSATTESLSPPLVEVTETSPSTLAFRWTEINAPVDQWLVVYTNRDSGSSQRQTEPGFNRQTILNDLHPGTLYDVEVVGVVLHENETIESPPGGAPATTDSLVAPLVEIVETSYSTVLVRWQNANPDAEQWTVTVTTDDDTVVQTVNVSGSETEKLFTNLLEGTEYNIQVTGFLKVGGVTFLIPTGETSDSTQSLISILGPMAECVETNLTSLKVTWSDVSSDVTTWSVKVFTMGGKKLLQKFMIPVETRQIIMSDLLPETLYTIRVTGNVREGNLVFKTQPGSVNCTTSSLSAPTVKIDHDLLTFSTIAVDWEGLGVPVTFWDLTIESSDISQLARVSGDKRSKTFIGLDPESRYDVSVTGVILDERREIVSPVGRDSALTTFFLSPFLECGIPTLSSIQVDWFVDDDSPVVDNWLVELRRDEDSEILDTAVVQGNAKDRLYVFDGLLSGTSYQMSIKGRVNLTNKTYIADPETIRCETERLLLPLVVASDPTPVSFTAEWFDINAPVDSWSVTLKKVTLGLGNMSYPIEMSYPSYSSYSGVEDGAMETEVIESLLVNSTVHMTSFDGLVPATPYVVEVSGVRNGEQGDPGSAQISTLPLQQPVMFVYTTTPTSIQVNWMDIDVPVGSWVVRIYSSEDVTSEDNGDIEYIEEKILNGSISSTVFNNLNPDTLYRLTLECRLRGSSSPMHAILNPTMPLTAPSVRVSYTTTSSLTAEWDEINTNVYMWKIVLLGSDGDEVETSMTSGEEREAIFGNLLPDTQYTVKVVGTFKSRDDKRFDSPTGQASATTKGFGAPTVSIERVTPTTLEGTWEVLNTPVDSWTVKLSQLEDPMNIIDEARISRDLHNKIFNGLDPATWYVFEVVGNIGSFSSMTGRATGITESLTAPDVYVTNTTPTSVSTRWNNFNLLEDYWMVTIRQVSSDEEESTEPVPPEEEIRVDGDDPQNKVFSNLTPGTHYVVEVVGYKDGLTSHTGQASGMTPSLSQPEVDIQNVYSTSVEVDWVDINTPVSEWVVRLKKSADGTSQDPSDAMNVVYEERYPANVHSTSFGNLEPSSLYYAEVAGVIQNTEGPYGQASASTGSLTAPNINVTNITPTSIEIMWGDFNLIEDRWIVVIREAPSDDYEYRSTNEPMPLDEAFEVAHNAPQYMLFEDLNPDTRYLIEVTGQSGRFTSPPGQVNPKTEPLTAPRIQVTNITPTSIDIEWDDFNLAEDFWSVSILKVPSNEDDANQPIIPDVYRVNSSEPQFLSFDKLNPDTLYAVEVVGQTGEFTSPAGRANAKTESLTSPNINITNITPTSIAITWGDFNLIEDRWLVGIRQAPSEDGENESTNEGTTPDEFFEVVANVPQYMLFEDLNPDTRYSIEVTGESGRFSSPTGEANLKTGSLTTPTVRVIGLTPTTARVEWSDINSPVDTWTVVFQEVVANLGVEIETIFQKEVNVIGNTHFAVFDSLFPNYQYKAEVVGTVRGKRSPPGQAINITSSLTTPQVEVVNSNFTSLTTRWSNINDDVSLWILEVTNNQTGEKRRFETTSSEREIVFVDLSPSTQFIISVKGRIDIRDDVTAESSYGSAQGTTSSMTSPTVYIIGLTPTTAQVKWTGVNFPVDSWTIVFQKVLMDNSSENEALFRKEISASRNTRSVDFDSLYPATRYKAEVFGTAEGFDGPSGRARNSTSSLTAPLVEVFDASLSNLTVRWSSINDEVSSWLVQVTNGKIGQVKRFEVNPSEREIILPDLKPSTQYEVTVTGIVELINDITVQSPTGRAQGTTIRLSGPHVDCVETSSSSVTVEWTDDETVDVSSWVVRIFPEGSENRSLSVSQPSNSRRYTFNQMRPATTYVVEVKGKVREGDMEFDTPAMRDSCTTRPFPPKNIHVTERGVTRVQAQFSSATSDVSGYEGYCRPTAASQSNDVRRAVITSDFLVECYNLNPATEYSISVYSTFGNLNSEPITIINSTLAPPPYGTTILDPSTHTMLVEWQAPDLPVDNYEILYYSNNGDETVVTVGGDQATLLLPSLEPNTTYFIEVKAVMNGIESDPDRASERTLLESIPLQIEDVSFTSINVTWVQSNVPHARSYVLEYFPMMKREESMQVTLPTDLNHYLISNLKTATEYVVTIKVNYRRTMSPVTQRHATTLALSPRGPITFKNVSESGFVARWLSPDGEPKPTSYVLMYYDHKMMPITIDGVSETEYRLDDLAPGTAYNVTVMAIYSNDLESHAIRGTGVTLEREEDCSCRTYVRTQSEMQSLLQQMMDKIDTLTQKVEELTRSRRRSRRRGVRRHN